MKIETTAYAPTNVVGTAAARVVRKNEDGAQVQLSSAAARIASGEPPPIDSARVQEIKAAIAEGRFRINPEAIAERLISTAQELIATQRQAE